MGNGRAEAVRPGQGVQEVTTGEHAISPVKQEQPVKPFVTARSPRTRAVEMVVHFMTILATVVGLAVLVLEYGFLQPARGFVRPPLSPGLLQGLKLATVAAFIIILWLQLLLPNRREFFKEYLVELFLSLAAAVLLVLVLAGDVFLSDRQSSGLVLGLTGYLIVQLLIGIFKFNAWLIGVMMYPARGILVGFAMVILVGALLLSLPSANHRERFSDFGNNFVDHLFTATSAVCVTGLTVRDTPNDYTSFGHVIIILLIQLGGLGIIIFGTIFALILGRQISIQEASLMKDIYSQETIGQIGKTVKFIFISTFLIEGIGAALLLNVWDTPSLADRIFKSFFHATSAFCNAGFALQTDNLIGVSDRWQVYGVIAPLIVLGGLGFPVMSNLWHLFKHRFGRRVSFQALRDNLEHFRVTSLTLHTKIVLTTTAGLIVSGMLIMFLLETPRSSFRWGRSVSYEDTTIKADPAMMANHSPGRRVLDAYFLSVTARTAGFNAVDMTAGKLQQATLAILITLMFIGGSPASTAGGIKTVTFVILAAAVLAALRQRPHVELFRRTIDPGIIRRAVVVTLVYLVVLWSIAFALVILHPQFSFLDLLFETASACGTVGLSTGVTPYLSLWGRLLIIFGMLAGRLGPLTLLFAMTGTPSRVRYEYPREGLITG